MNLGWASHDLGQPGQPYEGGRGIGRGEGWCWYSPIKKKWGILVVPLHVLILERKSDQPEQPQEGGGGEGVLVIPYKIVENTRCTFNPLIPKGVQPIVSPYSSSIKHVDHEKRGNNQQVTKVLIA